MISDAHADIIYLTRHLESLAVTSGDPTFYAESGLSIQATVDQAHRGIAELGAAWSAVAPTHPKT